MSLAAPALADRFFTTEPPGKPTLGVRASVYEVAEQGGHKHSVYNSLFDGGTSRNFYTDSTGVEEVQCLGESGKGKGKLHLHNNCILFTQTVSFPGGGLGEDWRLAEMGVLSKLSFVPFEPITTLQRKSQAREESRTNTQGEGTESAKSFRQKETRSQFFKLVSGYFYSIQKDILNYKSLPGIYLGLNSGPYLLVLCS